MRKTLLTLLLTACCLTASSASNNLLPTWFGQEDASTRIGIAPPTANEAQGRTIALINATLNYLRTQQEGKMAGTTENSLSNKQRGDEAESQEKLQSKTLILYEHFDCVVLDEFRNSRGEVFVRCRFDKNDLSNNQLSIEQKWMSHDDGKEANQLLIAKIKLMLKGRLYQCAFQCEMKDRQQPSISCATNEGKVSLPQNLSYGRWTANPMSGYSSLPFTANEMSQSLGALQLSTYCLLPFIPKRITASGINFAQIADNDNNDSKVLSYDSTTKTKFNSLSDSVCTPYDIRFGSISKRGLHLEIQHANFEDKESSYEIPCVAHAGVFGKDDASTGLQRLLRTLNFYNLGLMFAWEKKSAEIQLQATSEKKLEEDKLANDDELTKLLSNTYSSIGTDIGVRWDFSNVPSEKALRAEDKKALKSGQAFPRHGFWVSIR